MHFVFSEILVRFSLLNTKHLFFIISLDFAVDNLLWFYRCTAHSPSSTPHRTEESNREKKNLHSLPCSIKTSKAYPPNWWGYHGNVNVNDKRNRAITNRKMPQLLQLFIHITYAQYANAYKSSHTQIHTYAHRLFWFLKLHIKICPHQNIHSRTHLKSRFVFDLACHNVKFIFYIDGILERFPISTDSFELFRSQLYNMKKNEKKKTIQKSHAFKYVIYLFSLSVSFSSNVSILHV